MSLRPSRRSRNVNAVIYFPRSGKWSAELKVTCVFVHMDLRAVLGMCSSSCAGKAVSDKSIRLSFWDQEEWLMQHKIQGKIAIKGEAKDENVFNYFWTV